MTFVFVVVFVIIFIFHISVFTLPKNRLKGDFLKSLDSAERTAAKPFSWKTMAIPDTEFGSAILNTTYLIPGIF
jgi:hypothetical protein